MTTITPVMGHSSAGPSGKDSLPPLRREFVAMVFALAVGDVGIKASQLFHADGPFKALYPGYAHLLLALVMIAVSWIGWSRSQAKRAQDDPVTPFQSSFIILLLDVIIVIQYFVLVGALQIDENAPWIEMKSLAASQAWGVFFVFVTYALWDIVAGQLPFVSLLCTLLAALNVWLCVHVGEIDHPFSVTLGALSLIGLVLLFRGLHILWAPSSKDPGQDAHPKWARILIVCASAFVWLAALGESLACDCKTP